MTRCVNNKCARPHPQPFSFCPYCGADCRQPGLRGTDVYNCGHEFYGIEDFCTLCGYTANQLADSAVTFDEEEKKKAMIVIGVGVFVMVAMIVVHYVIAGAYGPGQVLVDQAAAGKSLADPIAKNRPSMPFTGPIVMIGLAITAYGGYLFNQAKIKAL